MIKKWSGPSLSKFPWKIRVLKFSSLRPLIRGPLLANSLSRLSESPNQLTYFTIIFSFVSKLSFSVEKLRKSQIRKKLWLLEVTVKKFLELVLFNDVSFFSNFSKIIFLSGWDFQNGKNISLCKNSESYLQNCPIKNIFFRIH